MFFQSSHKEFGSELDSSMVVLVYNHNGYLYKLPILLGNDIEKRSSLIMTAGVAAMANVFLYLAYRYLKKDKTKK